MRKKYYKSTAGHDTRRHAWRRSSAESRIQLFVARGAHSPGSSPARDPGDGRCGTESVVAKLRQHVCQSGPAVDRAGEVVASAVAADAVFDPQRAPSDGRNGLQMLFRWFVGLNADDPVWAATVFTKNRDRLLQADVAKEFLAEVVAQARVKGLTSDEHFTADRTMLEA